MCGCNKNISNTSNPSSKFEGGGCVSCDLNHFDVSELDDYETMLYNDYIKHSTKEESLQLLINSVEGDYSQLSPKLGEIAEKYYGDVEYANGGELKANDITLGTWLKHKTTKTKAKVWDIDPVIGKMKLEDIYGNKDNMWRSAKDWKLSTSPIESKLVYGNGGGVGYIEPSRYDFSSPRFESPVNELYISKYSVRPSKVQILKDLKAVKSRYKEDSEYYNFSPVVAVVYPYQYGWENGWKVNFSTSKENIDRGFFDETNGRRYIYDINETSKFDNGGDVVIWIALSKTKDGLLLSERFNNPITNEELYHYYKNKGYEIIDSNIFKVTNKDVLDVFKDAVSKFIVEKYNEVVDWDNSLLSYDIVDDRIIAQSCFVKTKDGNEYELTPNDLVKSHSNGGRVENIESEINELYSKSNFINDDFNWKLKLLEMIQDRSIEAYNIYQSLNTNQKEEVLQELFELDNDMGSYGDGEISTSKENLDILLEDAKNGNKLPYSNGGGVGKSVRGFEVGDTFYKTPSTSGDTRYYKITSIDDFYVKADDYDYVRNGTDVNTGRKSSFTTGSFGYKVDEHEISRYERGDLSYANGGRVENIESEINELYSKSNFINDSFNWKLKLLEMLQDRSIEAYNIYQSLTKEQKEEVLQEQYEVDNDMGSDGDGSIKTTKQNIRILLNGAKNGNKYSKGGGVKNRVYIEFLNKKKNFTKDKKYFNSEKEAREWALKNFEKFHPDMIKHEFANGGGIGKAIENLHSKASKGTTSRGKNKFKLPVELYAISVPEYEYKFNGSAIGKYIDTGVNNPNTGKNMVYYVLQIAPKDELIELRPLGYRSGVSTKFEYVKDFGYTELVNDKDKYSNGGGVGLIPLTHEDFVKLAKEKGYKSKEEAAKAMGYRYNGEMWIDKRNEAYKKPKFDNGGGVDSMAGGGAIKQNEGKLFNEKGEMLVYKKQSDTSSIYNVDVYEPRKTDVEEYSKFKYCKREKNGRECVYRLDKKALLEMIKKEKFIYSNGGGVYNENAEMVMNQNNQIKHHTEELSNVVDEKTHVPAWVVAKVNRSASDLSDATHYLDGAKGKEYANGGGVGNEELTFASKTFSKSSDALVRDNLFNGEISVEKLRSIIGHEPNYPTQIVGSIKLTKCFLKPFYKI